MKVMILHTDRYGESPIQKQVVEIPGDGKLTKENIGLAYKATTWFSEDPVNDDGEYLEGKELEAYVPDLSASYGDVVFSKDKTTCHCSGEESDYIFLVI